MYLLRVYFHGPQTNWASAVSDREVVASVQCPYLWLAEMRARTYMTDLNEGRCGYAITLGDTIVRAVGARRPLE